MQRVWRQRVEKGGQFCKLAHGGQIFDLISDELPTGFSCSVMRQTDKPAPGLLWRKDHLPGDLNGITWPLKALPVSRVYLLGTYSQQSRDEDFYNWRIRRTGVISSICHCLSLGHASSPPQQRPAFSLLPIIP
jgi:hypothetical protein